MFYRKRVREEFDSLLKDVRIALKDDLYPSDTLRTSLILAHRISLTAKDRKYQIKIATAIQQLADKVFRKERRLRNIRLASTE